MVRSSSVQQTEAGATNASLVVILLIVAGVMVWLSPYKKNLLAFVDKHAPQSMSFDDLPWRKSGLSDVKERFETPAPVTESQVRPSTRAERAEKLSAEKPAERAPAKKHDLDKHSDQDRRSLDTLLNHL